MYAYTWNNSPSTNLCIRTKLDYQPQWTPPVTSWTSSTNSPTLTLTLTVGIHRNTAQDASSSPADNIKLGVAIWWPVTADHWSRKTSRGHVTHNLNSASNLNPSPDSSDPIQYAPTVDTESVFIGVIFSGVSGHGIGHWSGNIYICFTHAIKSQKTWFPAPNESHCLVCWLLGAHFHPHVFHSHNSPQTHQHNVPSLQQQHAFTHNIYIYLFSSRNSPIPNDITGTIIPPVAFHSFARTAWT